MSRTIAIFGAGTGLGRSVAHRFGREGFRVALVARNQDRLDELVADLGRHGIEAAGFTADLVDRDRLPATVTAIEDRFGPIEVMEYAPSSVGWVSRMVVSDVLDADALDYALDLLLRSPVALTHRLLPGMLDRGSGGLLYGIAASGIHPYPGTGNFGPALAAVRNHALALNVALAGKNVYAGVLAVGALVQGSAAQREFDSGAGDYAERVTEPERLNPDDLADTYWDMYVRRDRAEAVLGSFGTRSD